MIDRERRVEVVNVRAMQHADIPSVVPIERLCFGDRWTAAAFAAELDNPSSTYIIAERLHGTEGPTAQSGVAEGPVPGQGQIIGYAGFWLILEEAHITTIAVNPSEQGKKIGEQLLLHLIREASARGAKWLTLEVRVSNTVAQRLYEKYGFSSLGKRRGYYQDDGEDALVMWTENIWQEAYQARLARLEAQFRS